MERNRLHEAAVRLAEYGFKVFPCVPGAKNPIVAHGFKDATTDEATIATWWAGTPNANVGVATEGIYVIDIDPMEDGTPNYWMNTLTVEQVDELSRAPQTITPRNGVHLWFRQPDGVELRNTGRGEIAPRVDTRGTGGYVLVPPSNVKEHGAYWFSPGRELDCGPEDLPVVPQFIIDKLSEAKKPKAATPEPSGADSVEDIPEGQRNNTLTSIAGGWRRIGMSRDAIAAALQVVNVERCKPPMDAAEVDQIAGSVARYDVDQTAQAVAEGWANQEAVDDTEPAPESVPNPGPFPAYLLDVRGFLAELIQFNLRGALKRQPELALAGGLALMSVITGRKIADESNIRTNLMIIGICESGGGKERARKVNKAVLVAAGMAKYIGAEKFKSEAGLINSLHEQPARLYQLDEMGRWMAEVASGAPSAAYLREVITALMTLYTSSDEFFIGGAQADLNRVKEIHCPHAVLYGTTVPEKLMESLTTDNTNDGLLSRTLLIEATNPEPPDSTIIVEPPPERLVEYVSWWGDYKSGGNLSDTHPDPRVVHTTPDGLQLYEELAAVAKDWRTRFPKMKGLWVRAREQARKLALIHQLSLDRESVEVGPESVSWACAMVEHCLHKLAYLTQEWVSENWYERAIKRVVRVLRKCGGSAAKTDISRSLNNMPIKQIDELLERLSHDGVVSKNSDANGKRGRPKVVYTLRQGDHLMYM